ncbi:TonB-dependent receptor [Paludibaculum fermentans]|uniref:TonB-dependent receptor n=1 Tax=Paludibaculum fermentans TaxID=1473598 RepID=A0A7S7SJY6_PALFE|nr:carboxypeptidase regulatory-like domain-containing protein [Paludibaculum fermentans]QOY88582.1 TonB-dependent receptor [Paludibaculum fermentans]
MQPSFSGLVRGQFLVLALIAACGFAAFGQDATGRVVGVVTDESGAVVPEVKITVTNSNTGVAKSTVTGPDGVYQVVLLPVGSYTVTAEKPGFRKTVTETQPLSINQSLRFDLKLEVGQTTETVQVEATASGVETVNSTLSQTVTGSQITAMPLNGRNVLDLALLQPGVTPSSPGSAGSLGFNISGGRRDSVTFILDGGTNNNLLDNGVVLNPNPDAIAEFRILTSNYAAEYGRNAGGIVSVVTKSGSNQFHGSAYDYLRNDALNSNLYFNNAAGVPRPVLKRNQYGATLGGPAIKEKLYFFFSYQGQKQTQQQAISSVQVFTPAELTGDFSKSNAARNGPDSAVVSFLGQFPYFQPNPALRSQGIIDPTRIDPVSQKYIKAGLLPTSASGQLLPQGGQKADYNEYTPKIDWVPDSKDRLSVTLGINKAPSLLPFSGVNVPGYPVNSDRTRKFASIDYVRTFSGSLINDLRFSAQRNDGKQAFPATKLPTAKELGVGITPDESTGPPILSFNTGMSAGFSPQGPTRLVDNTYILQDTVTWIKGRHTFKGGFYTSAYQNNTVYDFYVNGALYFYGSDTSVGSGNDFADFLMGLPDELLQFPSAPSNIRSKHYSGFFQDEWRVKSNLTLTLGGRYEYSQPKRDTRGRSFALALGKQSTVFTNAPKGLLFPGDPGAPDGANFPDRNDFAPRFGFAYSPGKSGKTSIRGGFGVFFDVLKAEDNLQFNGQAPFFGFADLIFDPMSGNPTGPATYLSDPFGTAGQPNPFPSKTPAKTLDFDAAGFLPFGGGGVYFVNPNLRTPYVMQYNLSVQREVAHDLVLDVAYVGSQSRKLTGLYDNNPFILGTNNRMFNAQAGVPSYAFSYLDQFDNIGNAHYNSMQLGLNSRARDVRYLGHIDFLQFSYTWQKSIDNVTGFRESSSRVPYYNRNQFVAVSDFDLTHNIKVSGSWELPIAKLNMPKAIVGGWRLLPLFSWRTGFPLDVRSPLTRSRTRPGPSGVGDSNLVRADLVKAGVATYDPHATQTIAGRSGSFYFDTTAFSSARYTASNWDPVNNPAQRTYGTLGRNAFRGLGATNLDLALAKEFPVWRERVITEFRLEAFNVFNHTQFGTPSTNIASSQFGMVSSTLDPRIVQLALRVRF